MPHFPPDPDFDAQTLAEAAAIKADPARSIAARGAAAELARVKALQAFALSKIVTESPERRPPGIQESAVMESRDGRQIPITRSTR